MLLPHVQRRRRGQAAERIGERDLRLVVERVAGVDRGLPVAEQVVGRRHARRPVAERRDLFEDVVAGGILDRQARVRDRATAATSVAAFTLAREQIRPKHVGRHAAAQVLRRLPVVPEAALEAETSAAVPILDVAVVGPPVVVEQLIAEERRPCAARSPVRPCRPRRSCHRRSCWRCCPRTARWRGRRRCSARRSGSGSCASPRRTSSCGRRRACWSGSRCRPSWLPTTCGPSGTSTGTSAAGTPSCCYRSACVIPEAVSGSVRA